jgi:hypothetical protein
MMGETAYLISVFTFTFTLAFTFTTMGRRAGGA